MQPVRLLAVFAENKPDQLARITAALAEAHINIHWVGIADVRKFGVIRFLLETNDLTQARLVLTQQNLHLLSAGELLNL